MNSYNLLPNNGFNPSIEKFKLNFSLSLDKGIHIILFMVLLWCNPFRVDAGIEPELRVYRTGSTLNTNDTMIIYDHLFLNGSGGSILSPTGYHLKKCKTYITLEINQETIKDCNFTTFSYSVTLDLIAKNQSGNPLTLPNTQITLQIDYDKTTGNKYKDKHTIEIDGAYWLSTKLISLGSPSLNDFVKISLGTVIERYQDINTAQFPSFNAIAFDATKNEYLISWQPKTGAEEYDLEWAWYDDYPSTGTTPTPAAGIEWSFNNNASRVTLKGTSYSFSNIYERGYIIFRIRSIGYTGPNFNHRVEGVWSSNLYSNHINAFANNDLYYIYDISTVGSVQKEHEPYLNWQYQVTFAEEGKKKEIVSYFDGSLRGRQIVTKTNSNGEAIVAETVYDNQGRAAVSFLPAPSFEKKIKYYGNFNISNVTGLSYDKVDFDVTGSGCSVLTSEASTYSGASKYYSENNTLVGNMHYEYLPHAKKYPMTLTEYMPDGTGRIKRQGGVGADHQLGTNHETRYFYGVPEQVELDRLFGSNVGYSKHYQKNMVVDPNGQVSVSYLDLQGRVIATALAGAVPSNVEVLDNRPTAIELETDVAEGSNVEMIPNGIQLSKKFNVAQPTLHKFKYNVNIPRFTDASKSGICFDCVYDLTISLKDECGNEMLDGDPNTSGNQPIVRVLGKPGSDFDLTCETPSLTYSFQNDALINDEYFEVTLNLGSYTLSRTLSTNMQALDFYQNEYLNSNTTIKTPEDFRTLYFDKIDYSGCGLTCEDCEETYGAYSTFLQTYLNKLIADTITPNAQDTINIRSAYDKGRELCRTICDNPNAGNCELMLNILKADVTPGGQYAKFGIVSGTPTYTGVLDVGFSTLDFNWMSYKVGTNPLPIDYRDEDNNEVKVLSNGNWISPASINDPEEIIKVFNEKMADVLVKYHPEYCMYNQCILNNKSEVYDKNMLLTTSFEAAVDSGFMNPLGATGTPFTAITRQDPYFMSGGQGVAEKTTLTSLMAAYKNLKPSDGNCTNLSLWDLVKATYLCNLDNCANINSCLSLYNWNSIECKPYLDIMWAMFRAVYLAEKAKIKENLTSAICNRSPNYIITRRFMTQEEVTDLMPSDKNTRTLIKNYQDDQINLECDTACEAYADQWLKQLAGCNLTTTVWNKLKSDLIKVCKNGCDKDNPFGSSSCDPTKPKRFTSPFNSFQEVWYYYVNVTNEITQNQVCDINILGFPKAYGHNYTDVERDPAKCRPIYVPSDSCLLNNTNSEVRNTLRYTVIPADNTPCKKCIDCEKMHIAVKALQAKYSNHFFDTSDATRKIAENFFNNYLDFNLTYWDYIFFMKQCRNDSFYLNIDSTVWYYYNTLITGVPLNLKPHTPPSIDYEQLQWASAQPQLIPTPIPYGTVSLDTCHCRMLAQLEEAYQNLPPVPIPPSFNDYITQQLSCNEFGGFDYTSLLQKCKDAYAKGISQTTIPSDPLMRAWGANALYELKYIIASEDLYIPNCFDCTDPDPNDIHDDCAVSCSDVLGFLIDYDQENGTNIRAEINSLSHPYTYLEDLNQSELRQFVIAFHNHFPDVFPCGVGDSRPGAYTSAELGLRTLASFIQKYAHCLFTDKECNDTFPAFSTLNCCVIPDTNKARLLQDFLNDLTNPWPMGVLNNHLHYSNWLMHPNFSSFYDTKLYSGLSETTLNLKSVPYYTNPSGKSGIKLTIKDDLGFEGNIVMQQITGTSSQIYWGFVKKFWSLRPMPDCNKSGVFQVYIEQQLPNSLIKDTFILCGEYDMVNFIITCDRNKRLCDDGLLPPLIDTIDRCREQLEMLANWQSEMAYKDYIDSVSYDFRLRYLAKCKEAFSNEQFVMKWQQQEFHHTLYYYDQASNLIQTVPPAGVVPITSSITLSNAKSQRKLGNNPSYDVHTLVTRYTFNTLNQLVKQNTPDAGESKFWYDKVGRMAISQNAKQQPSNKYSYTTYDLLGRINEVGQATNTTLMSVATAFNPANLATWISNATKGEVTRTLYDISSITLGYNTFNQDNLRGRVVSVIYQDSYNSSNSTYNQAVHYDYDIHGNVRSLLRENKATALVNIGHQYKQTDYIYDLISGKVNYVSYQKGYEDQFIHRYQYDADNRITEVLTGTDGRHWDRDARYSYFMHGPINRTEIGQLMVQGLDYNYTLQGWLKGVNSSTLNPDRDPGHDGVSFSTGGIHANVARDVMGFNLGYYTTDYEPISDSRLTPITTANKFLPSLTGSGFNAASQSLYNGNIRMMHTGLKPIIDGTSQHMAMSYKYDQLNRISSANAWDNLNNTTNVWQPAGTALATYAENFEYDPNGNILTLNRKGGTGLTTPPPASNNMDDFTYHYYAGTNRLEYVDDNTAYSSNYADDIDDQSAGNYTYDAIGNLISDAAEDIQTIEWTVYGKIKSITRGTPGINNPNLEFTYTPDGRRATKKVIVPGGDTKTTYYICDAQGNQMATYTILNETPIIWQSSPIYGSSRVGVFEPNMVLSVNSNINHTSHNCKWLQSQPQSYYEYTIYRGIRKYELSNHLGNVLAVISDKRSSVCVGGVIDHYVADVMQVTDFFCFGSPMPGRTWVVSGVDDYRYGFNGKETDPETDLQDYGFRIYNSRLCKFLSVDPLTKQYPGQTPYQFAENQPIWAIDLDGLEKNIAIAGQGNGENYHSGDAATFLEGAKKLKANYNFAISQVSTGKEFITELENYTKTDGYISSIVSFTHSGEFGMALNWNEGFFKADQAYGGKNEATTDDLDKKIKSGSIKFAVNAIWIFASCNTNNTSRGVAEPIALEITNKFGIKTIGSTGLVSQELTEDGKGYTGRLVTNGKFILNERKDIFLNTVFGKVKLGTYTKSTDLGDTIDPADYIPKPGDLLKKED
jgi:RHS repeat-associated protein